MAKLTIEELFEILETDPENEGRALELLRREKARGVQAARLFAWMVEHNKEGRFTVLADDDAMLSALGDNRAGVRLEAIHAATLGRRWSAGVVKRIEGLTSDKDRSVANAARMALPDLEMRDDDDDDDRKRRRPGFFRD